MKTKNHRKNNARRSSPVFSGGIQKFLVPPAVLLYRELRRLELQDRLPPPLNLHHID